MLNKKAYDAVVVASLTTDFGQADVNTDSVTLPSSMAAVSFVLDVTAAASDATDLLDVRVQTMIDGTNWVDVVYFTQVLGNGGSKRFVAKIIASTAEALFADADLTAGNVRHLLGDEWRINYIQVDAEVPFQNATFTFTVVANPM